MVILGDWLKIENTLEKYANLNKRLEKIGAKFNPNKNHKGIQQEMTLRDVTVDDVVVLIAGLGGSGKSSIVDMVAIKYGLKAVHSSGIMRMMQNNTYGVENHYGEKNEGWWESEKGIKLLRDRKNNHELDKKVDYELLRIIREGNVAMDSWTMPWLSQKGIKIWLETSQKVRAVRIASRDRTPLFEAEKIIKIRDKENFDLYKKIYKIKIGADPEIFDSIINTDRLTLNEVFKKTCDVIDDWIRKEKIRKKIVYEEPL